MFAVFNRFNPAYEKAARRMHTHLTRLKLQLQLAPPADAAPDLAQLPS